MKRAAASRTARDSRSGSAAESRPRGSRSNRRPLTWRDPLTGVHRALAVAVLRLRSSTRAIEAGERFVANGRMDSHRHYRNFRGLGRTKAWLQSAENQLFAAERAIRRSEALETGSPDEGIRGLVLRMNSTLQLVKLLQQAGLLHLRFSALSIRFREERQPGGPLADFIFTTAAAPLDPELLRRLRGEDDDDVLQWPDQAPIPVPAAAFRRVSRGRAPPALLFPAL
jgi:hypothetical protein